jgi:hypothetical protein
LSPFIIFADSTTRSRHVPTPARNTLCRTAGHGTVRWLDQLDDHGHLTPDQRARIAAEDGAATLTRALHRAELAGHDPARVLQHAIIERDLASGNSATCSTTASPPTVTCPSTRPATPTPNRTPTADNPDEQRFTTALTHAADTRRAELRA